MFLQELEGKPELFIRIFKGREKNQTIGRVSRLTNMLKSKNRKHRKVIVQLPAGMELLIHKPG
ncbi:hypothetical protein P872_19635 [Rhodonellum psychrophilum GCM71 = DSM 17998]|uniref:Uncharacterized protein n=1 Tax=Rhodonellum psychrophilum GCM71 = DSM 17998 TaxID=1123057 RepID=U5BYI5_9BACT|nr:hypothetical protein P872_19635 [Rhodonellum psychrophilum GCM71 = DSM 17998]